MCMLKLGGQAMTIRGFAFHEAVLPPRRASLLRRGGRSWRHASRRSAPQRCMFESNFPVDKGMCSYPVLERVQAPGGRIFGRRKAALFHGTAARFYRLGDIA